ncbi:MAG: DNA/RNA non-specific endonuclease [Gemmatimonadaceae bacterium]
MHPRPLLSALAAFALVTLSCSGGEIAGPEGSATPSVRADISVTALPSVRISEFHYDNGGTDTGEAIEVSLPAEANPADYTLILYNGSGGARYNTRSLAGLTAVTCPDPSRKIVVADYPSNGLQNGSPDGIALVGPDSAVIEFLSYEGTFTAVGGPANGLESIDIGVFEAGSESSDPVTSLKRDGAGVWTGPTTHNFGVCNDEFVEPAVVAKVVITPDGTTIIEGNVQQLSAAAFDSADVVIPGTTFAWSSLDEAVATVSTTGLVSGVAIGSTSVIAVAGEKADTVVVTVEEAPPVGTGDTFISELHYDNSGADTNERVEIEGPEGVSLAGWSLVFYNGSNNLSYRTTALSGTFPSLCEGRGVLTFVLPADGIQNGSPDAIALVNASNTVVEYISYEGTMGAANGPAIGMTSVDIGVRETGSRPDTHTLQRYDGTWYGPSLGSPDACNPPPPPPTISFSGRAFSDPPLPVGFQDQLFASLTDASGNVLDTVYVWSSDTPGIATVDEDGVITALSAGSATFRATLKNSEITETYTLPTIVATFSGVEYPGNAEFGEPADADASDDFILRHPTFTLSYSSARGTPNWVSYNLDGAHIGSFDRCDCFTFDPALPGTYTRYTTADYTGAGAFHGYGIDRGHLARSFDRTTGNLDNAYTFYFSNIIPQAADNNQGPWAAMESYLGDLARFQNKEVYIVAGVAGNLGTVKNEGLITIPGHTWKVAVIMPKDQGLDDIDDLSDLEVIAVVMPNTAGIRNVPWQNYLVTVDSVETLSGYDILDLLPDPIEIAVESQTVPPVAAVDGPYAALEHEPIAMSGAASTDADGDDLTYAWDFGDGTTGTGVSVSHAYAIAGTYDVQLIVSDIRGLADTVATTATIQTPAQGAADAIALIDQLYTDGKINIGTANSLKAKLRAALQSMGRGQDKVAVNQLNALLNQLASLVSEGTLSAEDAAPLQALVSRIIQSASQ